jgi:serine/threonine protein kinase
VNPYNDQYFIVMDRLYDTLEKRIVTWSSKSKFHRGMGRLAGGRKKALALYEERLVAAYDLASAVEFMHNQRILYRDLKTENVGFDIVSTHTHTHTHEFGGWVGRRAGVPLC